MKGVGVREFSVSAIICAFFLLMLTGAHVDGAVYDVTDYGATGDGSTSDTTAINAAVDAAYAAGGGTVYFPAGTFKSGSIIMKNNITLELSADAKLLATDAPEYSLVDPNPWDAYQDWGHSHWKSSLIWGIGLHDVAITGTGLIDGSAMTTGDPDDYYGDRSISFKGCAGISINNIKIYRGGHFAIITAGCSDVTIDNVTIDTKRDGMNIDCCNDVEITNCVVNAPWDDAICMKSTYALGYKRATEYVLIDNCTVMAYTVGHLGIGPDYGDEGWHAGRIKFGTESNGGFKNITITNCNFDHCRGFMLATVDGGDIDNIQISNIQMTNLFCAPIFMRLGNRANGPGPPPPGTYQNVTFSDITASFNDPFDGNISSIMSGIPGHYIENVSFTRVQVDYPGGGSAGDAQLVLSENESGGPDVFMFGLTTPSYGFYLRHVDGVEFHDCNFDFVNNDSRPAFTLIDVNDIELDTVAAERYYMAGDHITFDDVDNVNIHDSTDFPAVTPTYSNMNIDPGDTINAYTPFDVSANAMAYSNGVCTTNLTANSALCDTTYTWLNSWHQKNIELSDITITEPAHYLMEISTQSKTLDVYPRGDFNFSGSVNLEDFATFAGDWQTETGIVTLPNNPVAWWKLDENSGSLAYDSSVNNNIATLYHMSTNDWVSGHDGSALDFDGSEDYLRVPDSPSISVGASDYTLCAWIYPHTISHRVGIITKIEGNSNKEYAFYVDTSGRLVLEVEYNANNGISSTSDGVVQLGQWQHVMVTFDASTKTPTFYYNFREVSGGSPFSALPTSLDNDLYIGMFGQNYENDWFDGIIDDVRIYNYALQPKDEASIADLDGDRKVTLADLVLFSSEWLNDALN